MDPMVIDIIGLHSPDLAHSSGCSFHGQGVSKGASVETVIERWLVQYESFKLTPATPGDYSSSYKKMYKKMIILLRVVHSQMRLLPAYKIFRHLTSSSQSCDYDVIYKVSSFSNPFSREEDLKMKRYTFAPIEEANSRLCVSVTYRSVLSEFNLESSTSFPPTIIADYVGSPSTDPVRCFPMMDMNARSSSFPLKGLRPHQPSSLPSQHPHSWSSGIHGNATRDHQNAFPSGSLPGHYRSYVANDITSSPKSIHGQRIHNQQHSSRHHRYNNSYEERQLSPPFSPSSSPSTPSYLLSHSPSQSRLRTESSPVAIPNPMSGRISKYPVMNLSDPTKHLLPPLSPRSTKLDSSSSESPSTYGLRSSRKLEALSRPGQLQPGLSSQLSGQKVGRDSREDSGRFSGLLSSGSSPRYGFSRSSSRKSFQDDLDECDFSCPFDVDDVDTSDSQSSSSLEARKGLEINYAFSIGRKSQDAAVGALVQMLRSAPPLRQDASMYSPYSVSTEQGRGQNESLSTVSAASSGFFLGRKASDALEELRSFREMKEMLLSKSGLATTNYTTR